jgi:diguanylate cyclase (GGDEF)-like protein/PAS domain S-box-containing protein
MPHQAEANLSALIESTEDLIWSVDLDYRLITFNRAVQENIENNFGTRIKVGMRLHDALTPARAALWPPFYERALSEGPFRIEYPLLHTRIVELAFNPIVVNGKTTGISVFGKDITERKAAESALGETEKKYRAIFDGALEGMFQTSLGGKTLTANPAMAKMLGYDSPDELMALVKNVAQDVWANHEERALYLQREEQGAVLGFECQFKRKDGSSIWVSLNSRKVFGADGHALYREGFVEDITQRKLSEMNLRDSEERYRATFEQAAVGIVHNSFDGRILRCNERFARIVGYPLDEVPGMFVSQITAPENAAETAVLIQRIASGGGSETIEKRYLRKDGSRFWARTTVSLLRDSRGRPLHLIALVEDINARKAAEERLSEAQEALRASEERHRIAFQTSPNAVTIFRLDDGMFLDVNQTFLDIMGYEREEVIGRTSRELNIWPDSRDLQKMVEELRRNRVFRGDIQLRKRNGEILWGRLAASLFEHDGVSSVLTVTQDISDAKEAEQRLALAAEALRMSEERYRTAFQTSLDAININRLDDGKYLDVNQAFLDIFGYERAEVIGRTSLELGIWTDARDRMTVANMVRQYSSCRGLEVQFKRKNGEAFWGEMSASAMEVDGVPYILSITRDLSEVKAAENTIRNLAFYDPLTGLPNRRLLLERLHQTLANPRCDRSQALLFVELDNFKTLNETLGHQTGDLLLQEVARRIAACAREADTVGRLAGDEFVVMLEDLSEVAEEAAAQAKAAGEKILAEIGLPCLLKGRECLTTASIGITVFGDHREGSNELMQQADIALYQAKAAGRNTMRFFSPELQAAVNVRATLEEELRQAIKTKQLLLYYQPQVERGRLMGAEALVRWKHPAQGIVMPDEFIPLAEETGLILPMGDWVLEAACAQIASWAGRKETAHLEVSVNISALQFRQPGFVETVLTALDRAGANPKILKLELTESILVENLEEVIAKMTELKAHGLSFSLDDFGTGYSSLAYLKRLPLDQLKIDRAFVRDMLVDATSGAIAQTIISLGRAMGLSVIAEGVENEEQRGFLAGLGCHSFQGYLFSRPLPLEEFEALL